MVFNHGSPDVLVVKLPGSFTSSCTGQDFWELKSRNIWGCKVGNHWPRFIQAVKSCSLCVSWGRCGRSCSSVSQSVCVFVAVSFSFNCCGSMGLELVAPLPKYLTSFENSIRALISQFWLDAHNSNKRQLESARVVYLLPGNYHKGLQNWVEPWPLQWYWIGGKHVV